MSHFGAAAAVASGVINSNSKIDQLYIQVGGGEKGGATNEKTIPSNEKAIHSNDRAINSNEKVIPSFEKIELNGKGPNSK